MPAISKSEKKLKQKAAQDEVLALQAALKAVNQEQDILQHFPAFLSYNKNDVAATISFSHGSNLTQQQKDALWSLFETNMKDIYTADQQKWNPGAKKRELFHEDARYLLASDAEGQLLGYTHFRFELEDNLLSDDELQLHRLGRHSSVVYCYELQLAPAMHRKGLGRRLMQMLELLALKFSMDMVLLTVQRSNSAAQAFYERLGYRQHPTCPARNDFEDFDGTDPGHRILFKDLRRKS
ncbi:hypothetical protein OEZ86_011497 [Tetradesmus obliquus]|uniref:N-alpha-acetyltransferase 40 n=1 Tax=Tetradesmus obliquus TaxID=3088 RepID=A0A383WBF2_TETOB|nr:hypothetical protein OEZ86_011482 [Tetradesmus obliquus]WIA28978.1 hypothetical protein OEZ86_011497 [Tetradesmus obliquus]|eukprot:jgi/Sobl393_1/206/SZX74945.1